MRFGAKIWMKKTKLVYERLEGQEALQLKEPNWAQR
jgi:hypothetical protein